MLQNVIQQLESNLIVPDGQIDQKVLESLNRSLKKVKPTIEEIHHAFHVVEKLDSSRREAGYTIDALTKTVIMAYFNDEYSDIKQFRIKPEGLFAQYKYKDQKPYALNIQQEGKITRIGNSGSVPHKTVQLVLEQLIPMLPVEMFIKDLSYLKIIADEPSRRIIVTEELTRHIYKDPSPQRTNWDCSRIKETIEIDRHFTGAKLYSIKNKYYLLDNDKVEEMNKIFNAFIVELPKPVFSIEEAYKSLMPEIVRVCIEEGRDVKRQGGVYYIPLTSEEIEAVSNIEETKMFFKTSETFGFRPDMGKNYQNPTNQIQLSTWTKIRYPEYAKTANGQNYVKGIISFCDVQARHKDLLLNDWHLCIANNAQGALSLHNKID